MIERNYGSLVGCYIHKHRLLCRINILHALIILWTFDKMNNL